jgi:hypothetical protein
MKFLPVLLATLLLCSCASTAVSRAYLPARPAPNRGTAADSTGRPPLFLTNEHAKVAQEMPSRGYVLLGEAKFDSTQTNHGEDMVAQGRNVGADVVVFSCDRLEDYPVSRTGSYWQPAGYAFVAVPQEYVSFGFVWQYVPGSLGAAVTDEPLHHFQFHVSFWKRA